jgi:Ni2+-binding GTPase involved in maturation of urease and hydrogenase
MQLHLVGGFLGSGKTTAIICAAKLLLAQGKKVGVITNDQGKYLVDTAFVRLSHIPAVEVTGGCFCCNYDDLEERLDQLQNEIHPDVIFAESVGSCGDLVATVIKPLLTLSGTQNSPTSFTVFTDSRLLQMRLDDDELPFSENVIYIFDKQIEEAPVIVINKADLLEPEEASQIVEKATQRFPDKQVLLQNSLESDSVQAWVELIDRYGMALGKQTLDMDYQRYGDGEAQLAWLDLSYQFTVPQTQGRAFILNLIQAILEAVQQHKAPIGHIKFLIEDGTVEGKINITTLSGPNWQDSLPYFQGREIHLLINARVEMPAEQLYQLVKQVTAQCSLDAGVPFAEKNSDFFHPGFPNPAHRL